MKSILYIKALTNFLLILTPRISDIAQKRQGTFHAHTQLLAGMLKKTPRPLAFCFAWNIAFSVVVIYFVARP